MMDCMMSRASLGESELTVRLIRLVSPSWVALMEPLTLLPRSFRIRSSMNLPWSSWE